MTEQTGEPLNVIALPAGNDDTFETAADAWKAVQKEKSTAESADEATADPKLSDEGNAAADEDQPHGEDEEADPAEQPSIERPKSWTEAEDAEWKATPRALQQKIVARELERDSALRRSQNDAAEKLKGVTAKEQQAEQARQQYEVKIKSALAVLEREQLRDFSDIKTMADVSKMAAEDPFRKIQWDTHQQELAFAHAENERVQGEKAKATLTERNQRRLDETAKLIKELPELADKTKLDAAQKSALQLFRDVGYSDQELANMGEERLLDDHRIQLIINDAMKYRALQTAKTAVAARPVPPVQRPGAARPAGQGNSENVKALDAKLNNSGDVKDAFALYMARQRRAS